jgi:hypothetical protein
MKEKTLFIKFLGDSPKIRVLDMLITGRELEYCISDIAEQAGIIECEIGDFDLALEKKNGETDNDTNQRPQQKILNSAVFRHLTVLINIMILKGK